MNINLESLIPYETLENDMNSVFALVDKNDEVVLLKDNKPVYVILKYDAKRGLIAKSIALDGQTHTLQEAMQIVLQAAPDHTMHASKLADEIFEQRLYFQKNGEKAQYNQIRARCGHYPNLFEALPGNHIRLQQNAAPVREKKAKSAVISPPPTKASPAPASFSSMEKAIPTMPEKKFKTEVEAFREMLQSSAQRLPDIEGETQKTQAPTTESASTETIAPQKITVRRPVFPDFSSLQNESQNAPTPMLQEAMRTVLQDAPGRTMHALELAHEIYKRRLYLKEDGSMVPENQLRARCRRYPGQFDELPGNFIKLLL